jgi:stage II sporulation protein D
VIALGCLLACSAGLASAPAAGPTPASAAPAARAELPSAVRNSGAAVERVRVRKQGGEMALRVELLAGASSVRLSGNGAWRMYEADGATFITGATSGETWRFERAARRVRAVRVDGDPTPWEQGSILARVTDDGYLAVNGKPYRGSIRIVATDSGLMVVNFLSVEDYVRGVVSLELGTRQPGDSAALQAQAIAARSYVFTHLSESPRRDYDLTSGVLDQVYGGVNAETAVGNAAVESTTRLVLAYGGRVVNAPYHSTCGGRTAEAPEVWRTPGEPYLQSVSDRIPGTDRYYCDISPRFTWTRTMTGAQVNAAIERYLRSYVDLPRGGPGRVRDVAVTATTPSGRVGTLAVDTDRGRYTLRGNDIRFVLRTPGGEILNSTYFSVDAHRGNDGALVSLVINGRGNGHGVGMCQWGAIGRARAGQDFRTILGAYFPGTTIGLAD